MDNAVYAPLSPYIIIFPQMIISYLNNKDNLHVEYAKHDDTEYIIILKKIYSQLPYRSLTIPIGGNGIFHPRIMPGYTSFCSISSTFKIYECYSASHLILDSDKDSYINIGNTRYQSTVKLR